MADTNGSLLNALLFGGGQGGGGETVYFSEYDGNQYTKNVLIPEGNYTALPMYRNCTSMETFEFIGPPSSNVVVTTYALSGNSSLKTAKLRSLLNFGNSLRCFENDTGLEAVQLGDIGKAITSIANSTFRSCAQEGLTITVYVSPATSIPLANSPWGATNATVVYRSSVDGSVRT